MSDEIKVSPEAYREFDRMFLAWLDRNQEYLELAGKGNSRELATLCAAWARTNLEPKA